MKRLPFALVQLVTRGTFPGSAMPVQPVQPPEVISPPKETRAHKGKHRRNRGTVRGR